MGIYYVSKTGNDTTGDGAAGAPWLTLHKAISTVSAAGGHTIKVGAGTYTEASSPGTNDYWLISGENFADWVVVEPENAGDAVIVLPASAAQSCVVFASTTGKIELKGLTLRATGGAVVRASNSANVNGLKLTDCTITSLGATNGCTFSPNVGVTQQNITISGCTITAGDRGIQAVSGSGTVANVTIADNTISGVLGIQLTATGIEVDGNAISATTSYGVVVGTDTVSAGTWAGTIHGNTITSATGHAVLVGYGCADVNVYDNVVDGGDHSIVIKGCAGTDCYRNRITSGTLSGLYFKACTDTRAWANSIIADCTTAEAAALRCGPDGATNAGTVTCTGNWIYARTGTLIEWDAGDTGGSVVNDNIYRLGAGADWGNLRGSALTSLAELRAAWAGYDVSTNDSRSEVASDALAPLMAAVLPTEKIMTSAGGNLLPTDIRGDTATGRAAGGSFIRQIGHPGVG
jgi:hypothetical protein